MKDDTAISGFDPDERGGPRQSNWAPWSLRLALSGFIVSAQMLVAFGAVMYYNPDPAWGFVAFVGVGTVLP